MDNKWRNSDGREWEQEVRDWDGQCWRLREDGCKGVDSFGSELYFVCL